jgi:peptide/nickel transport system permease protein
MATQIGSQLDASTPIAATPANRKRRSLRLNATRRAQLGLWVPVGLLVFIILACFFAPPLFDIHPAMDGNILDANLPFGSPGHLLGTDQLGDDFLARTLWGGRVSLEVGAGATALGFLIGSNVGLLAGYFGGAIDSVVMRILDVFLAFPALILALCVAAYLGPNERDEILAIAFFTVPSYARLARAATLRLREREFIIAGRVMGANPWRVTIRHVYPNIVPVLITVAPLTIAVSMVIEASLSFLGLGVRPPLPSWGNMIASAQDFMNQYPMYIIVPSVCLFVTVFCFNLIGEQIRNRLGGR